MKIGEYNYYCIPQSQSQNSSKEMEDFGDSGSLSCRTVRWTKPLHVCVHVLLALPSVLGTRSMALVLWLPLKYYYYAGHFLPKSCVESALALLQ